MPALSDPVSPPGAHPAAAHDLPSLPATQRHASFPPRPPDLAAALLPPGLSLTRLGCAAQDDQEAGPGPSTLARAASESLLFGGGRISPPATTTTRHASYGPGSELDWGLRRLSLDTGSNSNSAVDAKAKRERAAVREGWEDPALAAARRALWADDADDETVASIPSTTASNGLVGALAERSRTLRADADAAAPSPAAAPTSEERRDQEDSPGATADDHDDDDDEAYALLLPPPACMPCHATLSPRASCLRNSPLARSASLAALSCSTSSFSSDSSPVSLSDSAALPPSDSDTPPTMTTTSSSSRDRDLQHRRNSSSGGGGGRLSPSATSTSTASTSAPPSVSFSPAPPLEGATYSAVDYERGGDGPVEKLSVREWIELQGVREAVGVWSGKIGPWSAELEAALQNAAADLGSGGGGGDGSTTAGKRFGSSQASPSSCTAPAALVGVVQVTKSAHNSPVLGSAPPLWR